MSAAAMIPLGSTRWRAGLDRLRAGLGLPAAGDAVRIVQALPLGPGTRLLVVDFAGRRLLIGQSRAGLARLDGALPVAEAAP